MRILLATPIYPPEAGGPATYTKELAHKLSEEHDITIVAYADEPEHVRDTRLVVVSKKTFLPIRLALYFYILLREAKEADVIYVQNAVASGLPAVLVGKLRHIPVVLKFVGDEAWERATQAGRTRKSLDEFLATPEGGFKTFVFISIQRYVLTRATKIVPPSQFLRDIVVKHYGVDPKRVEVNYNAFQGSITTKEEERIPHQILSVGRLVSWKGVDGVIRATKILKNTFHDVRLVVAGDGPEQEKLQKLTRQLEIEKAVEFVGRVSQEEVQKLQAASSVQVLNSTYEGLPHVALEAFAANIPMVATDIPGTREAVIDKQSGLLVPLNDEVVLASTIERIFTQPELREELTEGGKKILKEKFSWGAHLATLLAVFGSVIENENA